jgi:hypothetical protein
MKRKVFASVFATIILLECLLRVFDPYGYTALQASHFIVNAGYITHPTRGYALADRCYKNSQWGYCVENGARVVPDTNLNARKTLVLVGDSVLFGWGVNNADTAANLIAKALPDWRVINAAVPGYSSENIYATFEQYREVADLTVYLVTPNDIEVSFPRDVFEYAPRSGDIMTLEYLRMIYAYAQPIEHAPVRYLNDLYRLHQAGVILVGFEDNPTLPHYAYKISRYSETLSMFDGHPSIEGQREIAAQMIGIVQALIAT